MPLYEKAKIEFLLLDAAFSWKPGPRKLVIYNCFVCFLYSYDVYLSVFVVIFPGYVRPVH